METIELPNGRLSEQTEGLIGFEEKYKKIARQLRLLLEKQEVREWSIEHYGRLIGACLWAEDRHGLAIFSGDVGTGKTITAECTANRLSRELKREGRLLKVGADIRGTGLHGEMSRRIGEAFSDLVDQAGKRRIAFLLVDEADAIATERSTEQMHQEEKAGVNFLIQGLDGIRRKEGRAMAFLCTNRVSVLDAAIVRRAACHLVFERPTVEEATELLRRDLAGTGIPEDRLKLLAERTTSRTGRTGIGYTYSDYRQRLLPEAVARAYPGTRLTWEILQQAAEDIQPTPEVT